MGFFIALFTVICVLAAVAALLYWIDKDANSRDSA